MPIGLDWPLQENLPIQTWDKIKGHTGPSSVIIIIVHLTGRHMQICAIIYLYMVLLYLVSFHMKVAVTLQNLDDLYISPKKEESVHF